MVDRDLMPKEAGPAATTKLGLFDAPWFAHCDASMCRFWTGPLYLDQAEEAWKHHKATNPGHHGGVKEARYVGSD